MAACAKAEVLQEHRGRSYFRQVTRVEYPLLTFEQARKLAESALYSAKDYGVIVARFCTDPWDCEPLPRGAHTPFQATVKLLNDMAPRLPRQVGELISIHGNAVLRYRGSGAEFRTQVLQGRNPLELQQSWGRAEIVHIQYWMPAVGGPQEVGSDEALDVFLTVNTPIDARKVQGLFDEVTRLLHATGRLTMAVGQVSWFPMDDRFPGEDPFRPPVRMGEKQYESLWFGTCYRFDTDAVPQCVARQH